MAKTVAILQSNYIPWRGYFDIMRRCDLFIVSDTVQYTKRDWRNRNSIKTPKGKLWLTIPVHNTPRSTTRIDEVQVADPHWPARHIETLQYNYRKAAAYAEVSPWLFALMQSLAGEQLLSRINTRLLVGIAEHLGIVTPIVQSSDVFPRDTLNALDKNARPLALCRAVGASCYLSGPAAKAYLDEQLLGAHGIDVAWMSYKGYPAYPQLWGDFEPNVSIVDLLLNTGARARDYFPSLRGRQGQVPHAQTAVARP